MTLRNNLIKYIIEPKLELPLKANRKHKTILAIGDSWTSENILCPTNTEDWDAYDQSVISNRKKVVTLQGKLLVALMRPQDASNLSSESRAYYKRLLSRNAEQMIEIARELEHPEILTILLETGVLNKKKEQVIQNAVSSQ